MVWQCYCSPKKNVNIIGKVILDHRYGFNRRTWKSLLINALKSLNLFSILINSLLSRDINMNKWNCEVRKRINRKEFRDFTTDINVIYVR
eukprot:Pgem_evm1s11549